MVSRKLWFLWLVWFSLIKVNFCKGVRDCYWVNVMLEDFKDGNLLFNFVNIWVGIWLVFN